jgi:hypothetical protein
MIRLKNIYKFIGLLSLILLHLLSFSQSDSLSLKRLKERKLSKNVIDQYFEYNDLSYKIDADIQMGDKNHNLNITYRNIKDSVIWININHNTGIPVARFLITPDSTKFLNRIDNKYILLSNDQLVQKFNYDFDFDMIQSIFVSRLMNLDPEKDIIQTYSRYKVYQDSGLYIMQNIKKKRVKRLTKKNKIDEYFFHKVFINHQFWITAVCLEDNLNSQKIRLDYIDYTESDKKRHPKNIELQLKSEKENVFMKMTIKKAKFDSKNLSTPFKIPSKYELMPLENNN